jgi:2-amino-4-hydroxy-6-hydroxymethyldihydropteridine diphosphokinase
MVEEWSNGVLQSSRHFDMLVYIGIGSNLGDKRRNCGEAVERIGRIPGCKLLQRSPWYLTRPVGVEGQDWYLNGAVSLKAEIPARKLLARLLGIEAAMGRVRTEKWGPRVMDLDILLFGQEMINDPDLQVPHPLMHTRGFVLVPMVHLAPQLVHPILRRTMEDLLHGLEVEAQEVIPLED